MLQRASLFSHRDIRDIPCWCASCPKNIHWSSYVLSGDLEISASNFIASMGDLFRVSACGRLPQFTVCLAETGQILWPTTPFFVAAYGETLRQFLKVLDKSSAPIHAVHNELFGCGPPPQLAVTCWDLASCFSVVFCLYFDFLSAGYFQWCIECGAMIVSPQT